jgi:hypothetical protein
MGQKDSRVWGIYPEEQKHLIVQKKVSCQPCEKAVCENNVCMTEIPVEEVAVLSVKVLKQITRSTGQKHAAARAQ